MKTVNLVSVPGTSSFLLLQAFFIPLLLLLASSSAVNATAFVWTNTLGGNWSALTNWSPNGVPGASDTASISSNGTYTITINSAQSVGTLTMNALSGAQTLNIVGGGTLTINGASTGNANGILEVSGGTLTGTGSLVLAGPLDWTAGTIKGVVQFNGGAFSGSDFLQGGQLINVGTLAWNGVISDGVGSIVSNAPSGTVNATGSGALMQNQFGTPQTFYNAGQFNISANPALTIADDFVNSGTTTISAGTVSFTGGGTNTSTISVTASTAALQFGGGTFTNTSGSTISDSGSLIFSAGTANMAGAVTVGVSNIFNGATANVTGNYPITNLLVISLGTVGFNGTGALTPPVMTMSGGTVTGNVVTVTGPLNWSGGTIKSVVQFSGGTFSGSEFLQGGEIINMGTLAWNGPTIDDGVGSIISNAPSGTINATGSGALMQNQFGTPQTFYNAGQFNISASNPTMTIADDFVNSGTTTISAGTVSFIGGGTNTSAISVTASTAALQFGGGTFTNTSGSTISDSGSLIFSAGTANMAGAVTVGVSNIFNGATANVTGNYPITTLLVISSGTVGFNGTGPLTPSAMTLGGGTVTGNVVSVTGPLNWSGGTIKNVVQFSGGTFSGSDVLQGGQVINTGTLTWSSPTILDGVGSIISNAPSGTINATGSGALLQNQFGTPQTFYNAGQFNISASNPAMTIGDDFVNSGTTTIGAGTVSFIGGGTNTSMISVTASTAALQFGGGVFTNTPSSTISDAGSLLFSAGAANMGGAVTVGVSNIIIGGTANITGNYPITTVLVISFGTVGFNGTGAITPPLMTMSGGTVTGNVVTVTGPLTWSGGTIRNVVKCNGGAFSGGDLLQGGEVINVGTLAWNGLIEDGVGSIVSNAPSGIINATGSGALMQNQFGPPQTFYNAGQFNVFVTNTAATIGDIFLNSGTLNLNEGVLTFQGSSTNTGTINLNGATLSLTSPHLLTGGTLDFGINALNNYGSNILAGASGLSGTLASTFNGGYLPSVGNTYNIMTYGSSTGSFTKTNLSPLAVWAVNQNSTALSITVLKLVPQMSWTAPVPIVYGTALSSTQLDATAAWNGSAVPGTFTYTPPLGTVLSSGSNQTLSVTFNPTDTSTYTNVTTNVLITVLQAPLSVTASNLVKTYGQTVTFAGTEFSTSGLVNGDTATSATIASPGAAPTASVAGSPYTITVTNAQGTTGLTNYIITYSTGTLTVNPAALTITANNRIKTYGQTVTFAGTEFTPSGLQNGETIGSVTLTSSGAAPTAAVSGSPYNIVSSAATGGTFTPGNYNIAYANGALTVNTASLSITANNRVKTYGQSVTFAGTEFTPNGLQNGETIGSVTLTSSGAAATAAVSGSPYNIVPSAATGGTFTAGNYGITYNNGSLTVNTASLTITANNRIKTYGQTVTFAGTEFTPSGLQNGETIGSVTLTSSGAAATAPVSGSPYSILPSAATGGTFTPGNYGISYANGALTVNTASLTITADNTNKIFGQTIVFSGHEFTAGGLQNSETVGSVTLTSSGTPSTAALGAYNIVPSAPAGGTFSQGNYSDTFNNGTLTVFGNPSLRLTLSGTNVVATFPTVIGETYQLQSATNILTTWVNTGSATPGTGSSVSQTNNMNARATFYRLQIHN
jgi:hypothetical protein